ncbi:hypothetical protein CDL12_21352 [Handroanthus impetiginosus]|uniref:Uncharacterized protein n=1 Tax=Handroanthus impetiginosus TaxID=429701 RepID=A0A2G9GLH0_9LAMI|nr:hypothetical protein CDL12_21352 [Handroanthus impetiginosus]
MERLALVQEQKEKNRTTPSVRRDCVYQYQLQQTHLCQVKPEKVMNISEAVQFLDGASIMDRSTRKSIAMAC